MRLLAVLVLMVGLLGAAPIYKWVDTDDKAQIALYDGDKQVGIYHLQDRYYRSLAENGKFGAKVELSPFPVPDKYLQLFPLKRENFGIDLSKRGNKENYTVNGMSVTKETALQMLSQSIPDDSRHLRLTIIGTDGVRKKVREDFEKLPEFLEFRQHTVVQDYPPSHWAVKDCGFECGGAPTIYLQNFEGKVLHHQDDYEDGSEGLLAALRKADPFYKKSSDMDLRKTLNEPWVLAAVTLFSTLVFVVVSSRRRD